MTKIVETVSPRVYLVGAQQIQVPDVDAFLAAEGFPEWETDAKAAGEYLAEVAGRLCYMSFKRPRPGGNGAYLEHIAECGHGSVLEHIVFNLIFTGVSRSLTHELVRHRAGFAYSQLSQRYVDEGGSDDNPLGVVEPPLIAEMRSYLAAHPDGMVKDVPAWWAANGAVRSWDDAMQAAAALYRSVDRDARRFVSETRPLWAETAARKAAREAARSVLPNAAETKIFVTLNGRAARHFVEARGADGADAEIRALAVAVFEKLSRACPNLWTGVKIVGHGSDRRIESEYPKV